MKVESVQNKPSDMRLSFVVSGVDEAFLNALRRLVIDEVPTLAVEDVEVRDNSSALYDEMIAHRLGLIPIKTDLSSYRKKSGPEDDGNAACELKITLKSNKKGVVTAGQTESPDPKCTFVHENMPIVKLLPRQRIELIATAVIGHGKEHAKWSPGLLYYQNYPQITLDKKSECAKQLPEDAFEVKGSKVTIKDLSQAYLVDALPQEGVQVENTDKFIVNVESWGQLSCKEMLQQAVQIMLGKCAELESALSEV